MLSKTIYLIYSAGQCFLISKNSSKTYRKKLSPDPSGEGQRGGGGRVTEGGEVEVVAAAENPKNGDLVLEDEGAPPDGVVNGQQALERHRRIAGVAEAGLEGVYQGGGGGA